MVLRIYTDGAFSAADGSVGGWAWALSETHYASGGEVSTTNNRMELTAILQAMIRFHTVNENLVIVSDSQYCIHAFNLGWLAAWQRNGWRASSGKPVSNKDLWLRMISGLSLRRDRFGEDAIKFEWVKGHSGDPMNDFVDRLAVTERKAIAHSNWMK